MILPDPIEAMEDGEEATYFDVRAKGWAAANRGVPREVPPGFADHGFLETAWLEGYDSRAANGGPS